MLINRVRAGRRENVKTFVVFSMQLPTKSICKTENRVSIFDLHLRTAVRQFACFPEWGGGSSQKIVGTSFSATTTTMMTTFSREILACQLVEPYLHIGR